ncbi:histidine kinase [Luteimonas sp. SJ-92]|uniref:Histidine kinase n=1 Tax=Luteimonas salinisoli TaxID=2752307 RepID=A0A853JA55_9GAMM|nr:histidine kinase [Luteimonas salinisoli]NZA25557.1 histidine kinase [Luteimonas salinisoli]
MAGLLVVGAAAALAAVSSAAGAASDLPTPAIATVKVMEGDDALWAAAEFDDRGWEEMRWYRIDPQGRLVWVRAHVSLPTAPALEEAPLAVYVSALAAYEVHWNGERIGGSGTPGASESLEIPGKLDTVHHVPRRLVRKGDNVLAVRMSSFHLRRVLAGPVHLLAVGEYGALHHQAVLRRLPAFAAAGALLLGAVYFAAMFFSDRRDRGSLLLSLLSLAALVQLAAELSRVVFSYEYPLHILRLEIVLAAAAASGLLLGAYVVDLYAVRHRRALMALALATIGASALAVPGFDGKTAYVILSALLVVVVAAAIGIRARLRGAAITMAVAAGLAVWLVSRPFGFVDQMYYLALTALLLFLFAQQVALLRRTQSVRASAELRSARLELELLKRQIQPHFLMNSLTAVAEWIESDPATGVRMIEALAGEFGALAAMSDKTLVPLADELELCRRHLEVVSYRQDRVFALDSDGVDVSGRLPPATLHTLLENALTHNAYAGGAVFTLEAAESGGGRSSYRLRSPFEGRARGRRRDGRGHAYVRARLREAFGDDWSFAAAPEGVEWVDTIEIPRA